jgi:hypothetical protein
MKRSAWRYLWKSEDIRKKLLITLFLLVFTGLQPMCRFRESTVGDSNGLSRRLEQREPVWVAGSAFWRNDFQFLDPGNGCVSIHYVANYPPTPGPDHSCS